MSLLKLAILGLVMFQTAGAAQAPVEVQTSRSKALEGLAAVHVAVNIDELARRAVPVQTMETVMELQLRQNGVRIASSTEAAPLLMMDLEGFESRSGGLLVYTAEVRLEELVMLRRPNDRFTSAVATVWQSSSYGTIGLNNVGDLRQDLEDHFRAFLNDYLKANPKR